MRSLRADCREGGSFGCEPDYGGPVAGHSRCCALEGRLKDGLGLDVYAVARPPCTSEETQALERREGIAPKCARSGSSRCVVATPAPTPSQLIIVHTAQERDELARQLQVVRSKLVRPSCLLQVDWGLTSLPQQEQAACDGKQQEQEQIKQSVTPPKQPHSVSPSLGDSTLASTVTVTSCVFTATRVQCSG